MTAEDQQKLGLIRCPELKHHFPFTMSKAQTANEDAPVSNDHLGWGIPWDESVLLYSILISDDAVTFRREVHCDSLIGVQVPILRALGVSDLHIPKQLPHD